MKLDPTFKAKWVAALRSGLYKQGKYCLKNTAGEYCCLGVACEIANLKEGTAKGTTFFIGPDGDDNHLVTPESFNRAVGLDHSLVKELANMNDVQGMTFSEIADYIEANL